MKIRQLGRVVGVDRTILETQLRLIDPFIGTGLVLDNQHQHVCHFSVFYHYCLTPIHRVY